MKSRNSQQGITLFVTLVLLVMVTMFAISAMRVSNTNLKVVSSMQGRTEAVSAAQAAIEQVISSGIFTVNPTITAATPIAIDLDGAGNTEYNVSLSPAPTCLRWRETPTSTLDVTNANDRGCFGSAKYGGSTSNCADTIWEIAATTTDSVTSAQTTVRQGLSMRVEKGDALNTCK